MYAGEPAPPTRSWGGESATYTRGSLGEIPRSASGIVFAALPNAGTYQCTLNLSALLRTARGLKPTRHLSV